VAEPINVPPFIVNVEALPNVSTPPLPPFETLMVPLVTVSPPFAVKVDTAVPCPMETVPVFVFVINPVTVIVATLEALAPTIREVPEVEEIFAVPATVILAVPVEDAELAKVNPPPVTFRFPPTVMVGLIVPVVPTGKPLEILKSLLIFRAKLPVEATNPRLKVLVLVMFKSRTLVSVPDKFLDAA
jgi:hypothetical protein